MAGEMVADAVLDAALDYISTNMTEGYVCETAAPTTRAEAITNSLADYVPTASASEDGDTNGRKKTMTLVSGITIDGSGDAEWVAITTGAVLLYVTTCTLQTLTAANTLTVNAWDIEIADPVAS